MSRPAGLLTDRQRRHAWLGFVATSAHAPFAAVALPDASWMFSLCVAGLVAVVLVIDDQSRKPAAQRSRSIDRR